MVAKNARDVLKKENELLNDLAKRASASAEVGDSWAQFFARWRETNEKLIGMADAAFDQALKDEIKCLEGMRNSITGDSAAAKYWKSTVGVDIENTKELL
jgi:hypothetical protein